jgi:nucleoside-diphosphate-sugar epimerase
MFVHASFAFVNAVERGAILTDPLRSAVDAILECEALALSRPAPACVVRLGYLYGPESADLRAYRTAFHLGRPYWSGPRKARQYHLHQFDAASALLAACEAAEHRKDRLRNRRQRDFVHAADGCVRASGRPANPPASAVVLETPRQGDHSRGTHAAGGAFNAAWHSDATRAALEAEVSGLPEGT